MSHKYGCIKPAFAFPCVVGTVWIPQIWAPITEGGIRGLWFLAYIYDLFNKSLSLPQHHRVVLCDTASRMRYQTAQLLSVMLCSAPWGSPVLLDHWFWKNKKRVELSQISHRDEKQVIWLQIHTSQMGEGAFMPFSKWFFFSYVSHKSPTQMNMLFPMPKNLTIHAGCRPCRPSCILCMCAIMQDYTRE